jgi:hypothetical protein
MLPSTIRRPPTAILTTRLVLITIGFTAPVKDRSEVGPHEMLPTFGISSNLSAPSSLSASVRRSAHFSVVALDFSVVPNLLFKPQKNQKIRPPAAIAAEMPRSGRIKIKRADQIGLPAAFFDNLSAAIARCPRHFLPVIF